MWKPEAYPSLSPYLICKDSTRLLDFLAQAFDGVLVRRFDRPDGSLMHAEVRIDDSLVMVGGGATDTSSSAPHIHLYVRDAAETFRRAIAAGATAVQEPQRKREDDDLRAGVRDFSGVTWWIATAR